MAPMAHSLCIFAIIQITKIVVLHEGGTPSCILLWCNTVGSLRGEDCNAWWWFVVRLCIDRRSGTPLVRDKIVLTHCGLLTPFGVMERVDCWVLVKFTVWRCFGTKPLFEWILTDCKLGEIFQWNFHATKWPELSSIKGGHFDQTFIC